MLFEREIFFYYNLYIIYICIYIILETCGKINVEISKLIYKIFI